MGGSRYCSYIRRQHKSNHILMIADLSMSVFYQKCMDPVCRKVEFRSISYPIPMELNPLGKPENDDDDEKMFEDIDDDELIHLDEHFLI